MSKNLSFEEPIVQLRQKIAELEQFTEDSEVDLSEEIRTLKIRLKNLEDEIYGNMEAWDHVQVARHPQRPTSLDYISELFESFIQLHGDRSFGDDGAIVGGIGFYEGQPVTVIGHQRGKNTKENVKRNFGMPHPEGYRKALRLMKQAEKFKRPIITFIDTPGAYCGLGAEERGQGEAIALNLLEMSGLKTPVIAIVIGEGGSGGALALGVADRIFMLENSIYSVISPEGLSSILWKDSALAQRAADIMKLTAKDLRSLNIIDGIIKESLGGAHKDVDFTAYNIREYLLKELTYLRKLDPVELLNQRYDKFRNIGAWE